MTDPADPFGDLADPTVAADAEKVAAIFRFLAEVEFPTTSPLYTHLATEVASELWIPALITRCTRSPYAGVLFFACVRELTLRDPDLPLARSYAEVVTGADPAATDVWPQFRELVRERADDLRHLLRTRSIQTNEVGRSALLLPAFAMVAARFGRPLAVIEIGCSAGLNLFFDRYRIDYGEAGAVGPTDSPVQLRCAIRGSLRPPIPRAAPEVASRVGIDLAPIDVTDLEASRWLEACVWPDVPHRPERLRAALALARQDPPDLRAGNAVDLMADAIRAVPEGAVACLDSTWVLAYVSEEDRAELHRQLDELGGDRSIAYVTAEYSGNAPWVPAAPRDRTDGDHQMPTLLGVGLWDRGTTEHRALAWMPPHGQWVDWLDSASAGR